MSGVREIETENEARLAVDGKRAPRLFPISQRRDLQFGMIGRATAKMRRASTRTWFPAGTVASLDRGASWIAKEFPGRNLYRPEFRAPVKVKQSMPGTVHGRSARLAAGPGDSRHAPESCRHAPAETNDPSRDRTPCQPLAFFGILYRSGELAWTVRRSRTSSSKTLSSASRTRHFHA